MQGALCSDPPPRMAPQTNSVKFVSPTVRTETIERMGDRSCRDKGTGHWNMGQQWRWWSCYLLGPAHQLMMSLIDRRDAIRAPEPLRCPQQGHSHDVTTTETTQRKGPYNMASTDPGLSAGTRNSTPFEWASYVHPNIITHPAFKFWQDTWYINFNLLNSTHEKYRLKPGIPLCSGWLVQRSRVACDYFGVLNNRICYLGNIPACEGSLCIINQYRKG
jgi:hypothetical protein